MVKKAIVETIKEKFQTISPHLNEKTLRIWAAIEAQSLGRGGITCVNQATGLSRTTIYEGIKESSKPPEPQKEKKVMQRIRKPGGGRKKITELDPKILSDLESLTEPFSRGDPESPLLWTCKSTTKIAEELKAKGHRISQRTVCDLLSELGYSLQSNRKTKEGAYHPDRNAQFLFISESVKEFIRKGQPVISVDTKKKELIGDFKNNGREWCKKGKPIEVNVHDFVDRELGKVIPYGIYDILTNKGWVSVGIDHDTAEFAVESIRRWWYEMGIPLYSSATEILITADCGGSNGSRVRLWKFELQKLANELNIVIHVHHFPPGTSKWNKIEHRMFSHITNNWRGRPLTSREVVVNLISHTKTKKGSLEIKAALDEKKYDTGIKITDEEFKSIQIENSEFHGEWNYWIRPMKNS